MKPAEVAKRLNPTEFGALCATMDMKFGSGVHFDILSIVRLGGELSVAVETEKGRRETVKINGRLHASVCVHDRKRRLYVVGKGSDRQQRVQGKIRSQR